MLVPKRIIKCYNFQTFSAMNFIVKTYKFLFYISQNYSFEILRPLQREIQNAGHTVSWFVAGDKVNKKLFIDSEEVLANVQAAVAFNADAVFVPGNQVPNFIPGVKVEVFHGLEWKKKGHFKIRGWFDLYCTHGPATTVPFKQLAQKHQYFSVKETGWSKLDPLFTTKPLDYKNDSDKTRILFAPTFSPSLTAAYELFSEIKNLSDKEEYEILVKFHPKMAQDAIEQYLAVESNSLKVCQEEGVNELLQWADIMISDTSSIIGEFSLLNKPMITLNNSQPGDYLIDIKQPHELQTALKLALKPSDNLRESIAKYAKDLHPYSDGLSANRILNATLGLLKNDSKKAKKKPLNLLRSYKMRKFLGYWKL